MSRLARLARRKGRFGDGTIAPSHMLGKGNLAFGRSPTEKRITHERPCRHCGGTGVAVDLDIGALIAALAADPEIADRAFTIHELYAHAGLIGGPLADALRSLSARRLGKLLHKIAKQEFGGLRVGSDRVGTIWLIARVRDTRRVAL